jgi:hypothetical protein
LLSSFPVFLNVVSDRIGLSSRNNVRVYGRPAQVRGVFTVPHQVVRQLNIRRYEASFRKLRGDNVTGRVGLPGLNRRPGCRHLKPQSATFPGRLNRQKRDGGDSGGDAYTGDRLQQDTQKTGPDGRSLARPNGTVEGILQTSTQLTCVGRAQFAADCRTDHVIPNQTTSRLRLAL